MIAKNRLTTSEQIISIEELITLIPLQDNEKIVKKAEKDQVLPLSCNIKNKADSKLKSSFSI